MAKYKVVHYINQFYAGMGGEDTASVGISVRDGAVGPGLALKANLGADYEIVKTIICGDNTIAEKTAEIVPQIVELVKEAGADLFLAVRDCQFPAQCRTLRHRMRCDYSRRY